MKRKVLIAFCLWLGGICHVGQVLAQFTSYNKKPNYQWALINYGFDFTGDTLKPLHTTAGFLNAYWMNASVCDTGGKLLFNTDGSRICDRNNLMMPNGFDVNGTLIPLVIGAYNSAGVYGGAAIIPIPDSAGKYYIFSMEQVTNHSGNVVGNLFYTKVDMNLHGGLGDVVMSERGVLLDTTDLRAGLTVITGDKCNAWVIVHALDSADYRVFEITSAGVNHTPVVSRAGIMPPNALAPQPSYAYMSIMDHAPDRKKISMAYVDGAIANIADGYVEVSDFDPATGHVANSMQIPGNGCLHGIFSSNSQYLYTGYFNLADTMPRRLLQYDLAATPPLVPVTVGTVVPMSGRLGPDGKIYLVGSNMSGIQTFGYGSWGSFGQGGVINHPDIAGVGCQADTAGNSAAPNFTINFILSALVPMAIFLPNEVPVLIIDTVPHVENPVICFDKPIQIKASDTAGWDYTWRDYDQFRLHVSKRTVDKAGTYIVNYNAPGCLYHADTFRVKAANFTYTLGNDTVLCNEASVQLQAPLMDDANYLWNDGTTSNTDVATQTGDYSVTVDKYGCALSDTIHVDLIHIKQYLGNDTSYCKDDPIQLLLQANVPAGANALWSTGSIEPTLQVTDTGMYWVHVTQLKCDERDTITIHSLYCDCAFGMPTAFTPNGDGRNDVLRPVISPGCPVNSYSLSIYSRWGKEVFSTTDPTKAWDGTVDGMPGQMDTYMYVVKFNGGVHHHEQVQKGDVTLIR